MTRREKLAKMLMEEAEEEIENWRANVRTEERKVTFVEKPEILLYVNGNAPSKLRCE